MLWLATLGPASHSSGQTFLRAVVRDNTDIAEIFALTRAGRDNAGFRDNAGRAAIMQVPPR